jgi:two-component system nitrate/nitrite response regulator NarL
MANHAGRVSGREGRIRVLVVDDHALLREGLVGLLCKDRQLAVEQAASCQEAVATAGRFRPDVILVDAWLDHSNGTDLLAQLRTAVPEPKVVVLSVDASDQMLLRALRAGVRGLLDRSADAAQLVEGVLEVSRNETFISKRLVKRLISRVTTGEEYGSYSAAGTASLTAREHRVLQLVAAGETNKAIAAALYLSEGTVRSHLRSIMRKLDVSNRVQAAAVALRGGLESPLDELS